MYSPIKRLSASNQIYDYLLLQITSGFWPIGTKLPSETLLASQFEVSRQSIREALQRLRALGIIESRQGKGSFVVGNTLFEAVGTILSNSSVNEIQIIELLEFRKIFEPYCVKKAVEVATDEQILSLAEFAPSVDDIAFNGQTIDKTVFQLDILFHKKIVELSGNSLFLSLYDVMSEIRNEHTSFFVAVRMDYNKILSEHHDIYNSILKRDSELASKQMYDHLIFVEHYFSAPPKK